MFRMIDILAIGVLGVVVLFPKPDLDAHPEFMGETVELDRIAALEDARFAQPNDLGRVTALADAYLDTYHPDFALATLQHLDGKSAQVQLLRATAFAERLEADQAVAAAKIGFADCDEQNCPTALRVRLQTVQGAMQALIDHHIDPLKNPEEARKVVAATLYETHPKLPRPPKATAAPPKK